MSEFGQNIGVFYEPPEKEVSVRAPLKKKGIPKTMDGDKVVEKQEIKDKEWWINFTGKLFDKWTTADGARNLANTTPGLRPETRETIRILADLGEFDAANKFSTGVSIASDMVSSYFGDKKTEDTSHLKSNSIIPVAEKSRRLEELFLAVQKAQEGLGVHIMLVQDSEFKSDNLKNYQKRVEQDIGNIHVNVIQTLMRYPERMSLFSDNIWENLAIYLDQRGYQSKLIKNVDREIVEKNLSPYVQKKKDRETQKINPIIEEVNKKFGETPEVKNALNVLMNRIGTGANIKNLLTSDGTKIDIDAVFRESIGKDLNGGVEGNDQQQQISNLDKTLKNLQIELTKIANDLKKNKSELLKSIGGEGATINQFKELQGKTFLIKDQNGNKIPSDQILIGALSKNQAKDLSIQITDQIPKEALTPELATLLLFLGLQIQFSETTGFIAAVEQDRQNLASGNISFETDKDRKTHAKRNLKGEQAVDAARRTGEKMGDNQNSEEILRKIIPGFTDISLSSAQEKLQEIQSNQTIEPSLKEKQIAALKQYIDINTALARSINESRKYLSESEIQNIYNSTYTALNPGKEAGKINFTAIEKVATRTDSESTPQERAFAKIEIGQSLALSEFMSGNTAQSDIPELQSIKISKNKNGNFDIPGLKIDNINQAQVIECIDTMELYGDIGLSQLIPHIPMITGELRKKGINTSIDGSSNTVEQQEILKEIYLLLFGRKIETSNIHEVIRGFKSNLGNPTNMKNAMQHVLKIHHLIGESGQSIAPDTLQKWIRGNQKTLENDMNPLAYI